MGKSNTERFAALFRGLERAYGSLEITNKDARTQKQKGQYLFVKEPRTTATFDAHLAGKQSIGVVPINEDNLCVWGAIDIDQYPLDHVALIRKVEKLELPLVVCRSKSAGAHVFLFLKDFVEAEALQLKLKEIAAELGYGGCEIFPKQIKLVVERGDNGNFLNLPYFDQKGGLRYALKSDGSAATLEEFLKYAEESAIDVADLDTLLTQETPAVDDRLKDGPPCLQALLRQTTTKRL